MSTANEKIPDFLASQRDEAPAEWQHVFLDMEDFWERKLWHQLTQILVQYFNTPESKSQRLPIFKEFILSFADKINQLAFVSLGISASLQCKDDHDRQAFRTHLAEKVNKPDSLDAWVLATSELAAVDLALKEFPTAHTHLDAAQAALDKFDSVETVVHASFYRVNADYYLSQSDFTAYYKNALLYLACVDVPTLPEEELSTRALDLSTAALVSDSIYNFGELLLHPILDVLKAPHPSSWLRDLLFAFNRGDLSAFDSLSNHLSSHPLLKSHTTFLYQKISLAALTELVFRRPPHDRAMSFSTIAHDTKVQPNEIEHLIMKALSLGLLRGKIDQVAQVARINWVQPKVLERSQIEGMRVRLKEWDRNVNELGHWIEGVGRDVWAA